MISGAGLSVKNITQPRPPSSAVMTVVSIVVVMMPVLIIVGICRHRARSLHWHRARHSGHGGLIDNLVKLAAVQPHATASGTVIDFDTLTLSHNQIGLLAYRAFHISSPFLICARAQLFFIELKKRASISGRSGLALRVGAGRYQIKRTQQSSAGDAAGTPWEWKRVL
jgi:hypothetical protein